MHVIPKLTLTVFVACGFMSCIFASPITHADAANLYTTAIRGVWSFDVMTNVTVTRFVQSEVKSKKSAQGIAQPLVETRLLPEGTLPKSQNEKYRQIWKGNMARYNTFDPANGVLLSTECLRGSEVTKIDLNSSRGNQGRVGVRVLNDGVDYRGLFKNAIGVVSIESIISQRKGTTGNLLSNGETRLATISIPRDENSDVGGHRFELTLSSACGYMPVKIDDHIKFNGVDKLVRRTVVDKFHKTHAGCYVPIMAVTKIYHPGVKDLTSEAMRITTVIDLEKSRWNVSIPDSVFDVQFPAGTLVHDPTRRGAYVVGESDQEAHLNKLAGKAKAILNRSLSDPLTVESSSGINTRITLTVSLMIFAGLIFIAILAYRLRRNKR